MTLILTVTKETLEAALYQTGPRLVVRDHHDLLSDVAKLEKALTKNQAITGILALVGPVSFTRQRQTIALMNAFGAVRAIPVAVLTYREGEEAPSEKMITAAVGDLSKTKLPKILTVEYRAEPTITLQKNSRQAIVK